MKNQERRTYGRDEDIQAGRIQPDAGPAGLAAVLSGKVKGAHKCVAVLSSGNIDARTVHEVLSQTLQFPLSVQV